MKLIYIIPIIAIGLLTSCSLDEPDTQIQDIDFPLRLQIDEEGADLPDAEDYGVGISFADYIGDLPATAITLSYTLEGSEDFSNLEIDEILYEYEDDDCVYERAITFTNNTITIPVDPDLGTVPEEFEVVVNFGLEEDAEASDGDFAFVITALSSAANVVFSDANTFEYGILDNDVAGEWILELDEAGFKSLQSAFGNVSADLSELTFADITGEVKFEFGFEEMKMGIVLNEEEEVTQCENGEVETEFENLIVEIEADYDAEDGELVLEGSYFNEDDEELDFIAELAYSFDASENLILSINLIIGEDNYEPNDELFTGETAFTLVKD